ncbi:MAG: hypothetical protein MJZ26_05290 [Fibrobacter sp.]|nr:hypothetical protein [Fibrobacter sp.]
MSRLPPLRNLRKTTIVVIAVFLGFLIHRLVVIYMGDEVIRDSVDAELTLAQSVVCSHIVNGSPFGVDSVFEEGTRLYYYSTVSSSALLDGDTLMHIWFNGLDTVQKSVCSLTQDICHTTIVPSLLKPGEWSVDLIAGRKLLSTRQFIVEPIHR